LRRNSDLCHLHVQHKLIDFYNRNKKCLQRGTDWVFKSSGLRCVFKRLIQFLLTMIPSVEERVFISAQRLSERTIQSGAVTNLVYLGRCCLGVLRQMVANLPTYRNVTEHRMFSGRVHLAYLDLYLRMIYCELL
jgi:hypothetical protein